MADSRHPAAHRSQSVLGSIALALAVIGAINWGLIGLLDFNLVTALFGEGTTLTRAVYVIVGLAGLYSLTLFPRIAHAPGDATPDGYGPGHPDFVERRRMTPDVVVR